MLRRTEQIVIGIVDFAAVGSAHIFYQWFIAEKGIPYHVVSLEGALVLLGTYAYWVVWFLMFGLYRSWYAKSRLDEVMTLAKTIVIGTVALFVIQHIDGRVFSPVPGELNMLAVYSAVLIFCVGLVRLSVRALQKRLLRAGIGARNTIIVGWSQKAFDLCDMVMTYPALGYKVVGFIPARMRKGTTRKRMTYRSMPVLGILRELPQVLERHQVKEVLVGLDSKEHDALLEVIKYCNGRNVGMKIIPDLYDIVSGQARVSSIYGFPLIEISPEIMKPWEEVTKRATDILVSALVLFVGLPVWFLVALAIKINSRGTVFYKQERVGKNGAVFTMYKFRSMKSDAEELSGPKWAEKNDPRVTAVGRIVRRLHLDEVPQFLNVLIGDMSLVGPRPERPYFVAKIEKEFPLYRRRLRVRPGMTGWAQIKYRYDQSLEDVRSKLKYDLFYLENMSWRMDLKILFNTLYVMMRGKGHA